jgi:hypothetical protein
MRGHWLTEKINIRGPRVNYPTIPTSLTSITCWVAVGCKSFFIQNTEWDMGSLICNIVEVWIKRQVIKSAPKARYSLSVCFVQDRTQKFVVGLCWGARDMVPQQLMGCGEGRAGAGRKGGPLDWTETARQKVNVKNLHVKNAAIFSSWWF